MPKVSKSVSVERARYEAWERGILSWKLHAGQQVIENSYLGIANKFFLLNCSRRFGKTFWLVIKALENLISSKNPFPRIKLASATFEDLKEFILPTFETILADCHFYGEGKRLRYYRSDRKFVYEPNGGEIKLLGIDRNPDGGRGPYCDWYGIDEARNIDSDNLKYLYSSVIHPMTLNRPNAKIIMASTPPDSADHSFASFFMEKAKDENGYVELNIYQAAHLSKKDIEDAKRECITDEDWQREYLCQVITSPQRAIIQSNHLKGLEVEEFERPPYFEFLPRYVCMDLGVKNDFTAMGFGYWDPLKKKFFLEDEDTVVGTDLTTNIIKSLVTHKEKKLWGDLGVFRRIADNNNPLLLQDLSILHNLYFSATSKDTLQAMVNALREFIMFGHLVVHPRCEKTIGAIKYGIWNKKRNAFDRSNAYGHYDHLAMLMYLVRNIDQTANPVPWNFGSNKKYDMRKPGYQPTSSADPSVEVFKKIIKKSRTRGN